MACNNEEKLKSPICRACLQMSDVPATLFELKYETLVLSEIFEMCTSIQVEDSISAYICETCIANLVTTYTFIKKCQSSDLKLKNQSKATNLQHILVNVKEEKVCITKSDNEVGGFLELVNDSNKNVNETNQLELRKDNVEMDNAIDNNIPKMPFNCEMCGEGCSKTVKRKFPPQLHSHDKTLLKNENTLPKYCCMVCKESFDKLAKFVSHQSVHFKYRHHNNRVCRKKHLRKEKKQIVSKENGKDKSNKFQCQICFVTVKTRATLKFHMMLHTGDKPYMCDVCGKCFIKRISLDEHKKLHTGETPYVCEYCGKAFRSNTSYKWHIAIHSSPEDPVPCGICEKVLRSQQAWKKHQLVHNKRFLCNECGKSFMNKTQLTGHTNAHLGVRPHLCNICFKSFAQKNQLTIHLLRHQVVKPHPCDMCNRTFVTKYKLSVHKKRSHREQLS